MKALSAASWTLGAWSAWWFWDDSRLGALLLYLLGAGFAAVVEMSRPKEAWECSTVIDHEQQAEMEQGVTDWFARLVLFGLWCGLVVAMAFCVLVSVLAMAAAAHCEEPNSSTISNSSSEPSEKPGQLHISAEALTGYVATAGASKPYVGLRAVAARETATGGQAIRIEGQPHEGGDPKDVKGWTAADVLATAHRYISGDIGLVGVVGSSIPLEGGIPQAAPHYPILAGGLVQWRPRDGAFRVAAGVGVCGENGGGVQVIASARAAGPGVGPAGTAVVADGCFARTSLVRINVAVGVK